MEDSAVDFKALFVNPLLMFDVTYMRHRLFHNQLVRSLEKEFKQ